MTVTAQPLDARSLDLLKWRCRRGMLENDLLIERFFQRHQTALTARQAAALTALMDLSDNDLLDLLLRRTEPGHPINTPEVREVLGMLRPPLPQPSQPPAPSPSNL
ncbi:MAG: succinate dehydrogenase assembly factor 2 [Burkholderiaceae bacterium]|jgi:antitoxin CptB|nr:succinate dehydrogenase assembly factor 2 [Burkholderiaceae bacterium]